MKYLRIAEKKDVDMVYEWANDSVTRAMSFNTDPIPYENHVLWFDKVINDTADMSSTRRLLILMDGDIPSGQMRLDLEEGNRIVLSYSLNPECRGKGLGNELINLTLRYLSLHLGIDLFLCASNISFSDFTVIAEVKKNNLVSAKILENNGFTLYKEENEIIVFSHPVYEPLFIRADMNQTIATGHVMRCLAIADAASRMGIGVTFICADNNPAELIRNRGYNVTILNTDWRQMESELPLLSPIIECCRIKHLIVDSYQVTKKYLASLREQTELSYIDDVNRFVYPVDKLIVYANYYKRWELDRIYGPQNNTELILGTDYVPLRDEYADLPPKKISKNIENILVLSGGSDRLHILLNIMKKLTEYIEEKATLSDSTALNEIKITAICGKYNLDYDRLVEKYGEDAIIKSVPSLKEYIMNADVVISAGGTTLYEICACGTPAIAYSFADNQLENVFGFCFVDKLMKSAGDVRDFTFKKVKSIVEGEPDLNYNPAYDKMVKCLHEYEEIEVRADYSQKLKRFIDGHGADRIVRRIMGLEIKNSI